MKLDLDPASKIGSHPFENRAPNYQPRCRTRLVKGRGYKLPRPFTLFLVPYRLS